MINRKVLHLFAIGLLVSGQTAFSQTYDFVTTTPSTGSATSVTSIVSGVTLTATTTDGTPIVYGDAGGPTGRSLHAQNVGFNESMSVTFDAPIDISAFDFIEFSNLQNGFQYTLTPNNGTAIVITDNAGFFGTNGYDNYTPGDWTSVTSITITYSIVSGTYDPGFDNIDFAISTPKFTTTWLDENPTDGTLDRVKFDFSESVDITDATSGAADFDAFTLSSGAFSTAITDLSATGISTITIDVTGLGSGTGPSDFPDVAYSQGQNIAFVANSDGTTEIADADTPTAENDGAAPFPITFSPAVSATGIAINSDITITFSEDITDESTGDITLEDITGPNTDDRAEAALTLDIGSTTSDELVINPDADLTNLNEYSVLIPGTRISDGTNVFGGLDGSTDYNFTTIASIPTYEVTWLDENPTDGTLDRVQFDFSEAVNFKDGDGGAATFDAFTLGSGAFSTAETDFETATYTNITTVTIDVTGLAAGTAPADFPSVAYAAGNEISIVANSDDTTPITDTEGPTAENDGAAPFPITFSPTVSATGVAINSDITITFSEDITDASTGDITLEDITGPDADDRAEAALTLDIGSTTSDELVINPNADLTNLNEYSVLIPGTRISDGTNVFGGLDGSTDYNFTTIAAIPTYEVTWLDENPTDGTLDRVQFDFSEAVNFKDGDGGAATFDAFVLGSGSFSTAVTDFEIATYTNISTFTIDVTGLTAGTAASDFPSVAYAAGNDISIVANSDDTTPITDTDTPTAENDGAAPILISATTYDQDENGQIDSLAVTFSEIIDQSTIQSNGDDFTVAGYNPTAADTDTGSDDADVYILIDELVSSPDTDATPLITLNSPTIADLETPTANVAINGDNITPDDAAPPVIVSAVTDDTNGDGFIETVVLTFSEDIDDDAAGSDIDLIDVDGYSGESADSDNDDDDELTITFTPQSSPNYDTDATPNIILPVGAVEDGFDNSVSAVQTFMGTEDGAGPVFTAISIASNNTYVDIDISEGIYATDATSAVAIGNFSASLTGGTATTPVITNVTQRDNGTDPGLATAIAPGDDEIRVWFTYTGIADGDEELEINPAAGMLIKDVADNATVTPQLANNTADLNLLTIPQIVSSTWLDQNADGSIDAVEVRFDIDVNIVDQGNNNVFNNFDINGDIGGSSAQSGVITAGNPFTLTFTPADKGTTGTTNITGLTLSYERGGTNDKIRSEADDSEVVDEFVSLSYIDEAAPFFYNSPGTTGDGGNGVFGGTETILISVDLEESGLTVTADLVDVFGIYSSTETLSEIGSTGVYTFTTFQSRFLNNGTNIDIDITAEDAAGNTTTNTTLSVDIDSEAPEVTIDQLFTTDNNSAGQEITISGTTDDNALILDVTFDGNTYESDGAASAAFTIGSGTWALDLNAAGAGDPLNGAYDIDIVAADVEGNTTSESLTDGLVVTPGGAVTITPGSLSTACIDGEFVTMTNQIVFTEAADNAFSEGIAQTILIALPSGFEFNTAGSVTIGLTGTGLSNSGFSFLSPTTLQVRFDANAASLSATNTITVDDLPIKTTSLISTGTLDMTYQGGTAVLGDLAIGADLGDISNLVPTGPNSGNDFTAEYCFGAEVLASIAGVNSANHIWYDDEDDVYKATINHSGSAITNIATDLGISAVGIHTFFVTNTGGTVCESEPIQVTITINATPTVDAAGTLAGTFCSGEDIELGGAPTASGGAGSYVYSWSTTSLPASFGGVDNLTGVSGNANPAIEAPDNTNTFSGPANNSNLATITYQVQVTDANFCSATDDVDVQIRPAIAPTLVLDPDQGSYDEFFGDITLEVTPAATDPFTNGVITGTAISYDMGSSEYVFNTSTAGEGDHPVQYSYTDQNGCTESTGFIIIEVGTSAGTTFTGLSAGYCINDDPELISLTGSFQTDFQTANPTYDALVTYYDPDDHPFPYTGSPVPVVNDNMSTVFTIDDEYSYDPATHFDESGFTGGNFMLVLGTQPADTFIYAAQQVNLFQTPEVKIVENVGTFVDGDFNAVSNFYCEDDGTVQFSATVGGTETGSGAYYISRTSAPVQPFVAFSGDLTTSSPHPNDAVVGGTYRVAISSDGSDDPLGNSCSNTDTVSFTIIPTPAASQLNLSGSSKGVDKFNADPNLSTDPNSIADYIFRYCESETSFETLRVLGIDSDESVNWYDESLTQLGTSTADGSKISGSELFQTASSFPPEPGVYTFGFTVTDFIGASAGFTGCEGDFTIVQIDVYPDVVNPPIDTTATARGEDKSTGSQRNYFVYEYCVGETIEGLSVVQDSLTEDFDSGFPTGWTQTGAVPSGAGLAVGGTGNAIRLQSGSMSNEIFSTEYQSIQHVSFDYRTDGVATGASFAVQAIGAEGTYDIGSLVANSNTYQTFEADILGSLTDADIRIYIDVVGDVDLVIDNFSVSSTIPDKTFYTWSYDNGGTPTFIDGAIDGSDDQNGAGVIASEGNVSALATELMSVYGEDDTPAAGTYTFYVSKVENINSTDVPNFNGCTGDSTRIDIIVYSIPAAPTGFDTDINAHSGELNINTRILSTDLLDVPATANVDYLWSDQMGTLDTINVYAGSINNPDISYATLFGSLGTSGLSVNGGGYYEVTSTVTDRSYLFQVTNELNRETSLFPGCGSATGTQVDFTIYPLAEKPILSDTNDVAKTNLFFDDNSTGGDLTDDIGENLELNFCAGDLSALDSISVVSRYSSGNNQKFTWYRSNGIDVGVNPGGQKIAEIAISDADGSRATASELFLTGITSDLTTYYLVSQTTDIESGVYDGGESDSVRLKVNIFNIPAAPRSVVKNVAMQDSTDFYYCVGEAVQSLVVEENGESMGAAEFFWYASEADAQAGINRLNGGASSATLTAGNMVPDELDFDGMAVANLGVATPGTYTFYATQRTNFSESPETDFVSPSFVGCEGEPIEFTIYVRGIPDDPTLSSTLSKICEGENAPSFTINNRATGAIVNWYDDNMTSVLKSALEASFDPDDPGDGGITLNVSTTPNDFYVDQLTDFELNGSTFGGCISDQTLVQVTQFRDPAGPDLVYLANPTLLDGDTVGICETNTGALNFTITPGTGNTGTVFNWYQADETGSVTNTTPVHRSTGSTTGSNLSLLTENTGIRFFKVSQIENIDTDFDGCESEVADRTFLKVAIFDTPVEPTIELSQTNYLTTGTVTNYYFTYDSAQSYDDQLNGNAFDLSGLNVNAADNGGTTIDESDILTNAAAQTFHFTYGSATHSSNDGTATLANLGLLGTGAGVLPGDPVSAMPNGSDNPNNVQIFTYTVSQSQFDGQHMNPAACDGPSATVNINILPVPATPSPADADIFICDDNVTGTVNTGLELSITNQAAGATVEWWLGLPDVGTLLQTSTSATFRPDAYGGGTSTIFTDDTDQVLDIYVRQITNRQITVQGGTYPGSFSREALIRIEKFEEPEAPTVTYYTTSSNPASPTTPLVVGICEGSTGSDALFNMAVESSQESPAYFKWYSTNAAGVINQLVYTSSAVTTGNSVTVTGNDLNLETATEGIRYFKVAQVAEFDDFSGCETITGEMQRVQVNIFRSPAFPSFSSADNNAFSSTSNTTDFYLVYDSAGVDLGSSLYSDQLLNSVFTAEGTNTVGIPGDLTNTAPQEFNWYFGSSLELSDSPTADFDDLSMTNTLPRDNGGNFNNPTTIETFTFEVRQGQFRSQNNNPEACESPSQFVDVNIIPVPDTPTPAESLVELCEDETVGSLSITNRAPGAQVHWFSIDPRVDPNADTLNNIADFTYVPTEVEGNDGTYTYYVRQVTNVEIDGTNFQGAVSDVATVTVTVYPNAGVPESTADNNRYVYCLGEPIEDLQVANPENGVTYAWYGDINLNSFLGSTTSANNNLIPSLNGAFDENTVGTYNYYVTSTLAGQGCESDPTLVQIVINGLPDPEIKFNTGATFENEEDVPEFFQVCVDEAPVEIVGSTSGGGAGTFSGAGVTQGTGVAATFDPLLALGITDPLEMLEGEIDTVYVNYNLANAADCDVDYQVGFVITALPRPNFTVGITSPTTVPVITASEDAGVACVDIDPNNLATVTRMTLSATGGKQTGQFILSNDTRLDTLPIASGSIEFDLGRYSDKSKTQDTLFIRYVFADEFGCSYFKDKQVILHENPIVEYEHIVGCVGEPATFIANAVAPFTNDDIEYWDWTLINNANNLAVNDADFIDGDRVITNTFTASSTYRIAVNGRSANYNPIDDAATCVSIDEATINASTPDIDEERDESGNTQLIPIGDFPEVDFSWQFITENTATTIRGKDAELENLLINYEGDSLNGIELVWMDWGDGSPLDTLQANVLTRAKAFEEELHTYSADGWYNAKLKISTINGCVDSTTKVIKILPHITVDPSIGHINNFESATQAEAGWFVDVTEMGAVPDKDVTWNYGNIDVLGFEGSSGWSTDNKKLGYGDDPGSWVFSPSFDITAFEKPMVLFDGLYDFAQNDGAIMEYSTDNGKTWQILGRYIEGDTQGTGINWYGTLDVRADPGKQRELGRLNNASGWGFTQPQVMTSPASIRHKLDEIPASERGNVRFRFYFASTSSNDAPGLVFDNFEIAERGRISLVEQFSNSNKNQDRGNMTPNPNEPDQYTSIALNNEINARLDSALLNNNDLVAINYYTEIYGNDELFELSKDGPSARTLFYGLNNVTSILDGNVQVGTNLSTNASTPAWTGAESNRNTLRDADFDLQLTLNSSDNDELSVTANVISGDNFTGEDIRVYLAVVEKILTGESLLNGEFEPRNVFREFLPSPLGHTLTDLSLGGSNTLTETWKINARKVLDPDQLAVVAFVQKANGDREVYQAARVDVNGKSSILGVGDLIEVDDLNLYPNPARDEFFITFDLTLEEDFQWRLFDQSGRLMKNGEVFKGMDGFRVESADLPSGLYLMSIGNETKQYTHLKVIVKH